MIVQCSECKRIRVDGMFRLPWPGELQGEIAEVFCSRCARDRLARVQAGEFARDDVAAFMPSRRAANS